MAFGQLCGLAIGYGNINTQGALASLSKYAMCVIIDIDSKKMIIIIGQNMECLYSVCE